MHFNLTGILRPHERCYAPKGIRNLIPKQTATHSSKTLGHVRVDSSGPKETKAMHEKLNAVVYRG